MFFAKARQFLDPRSIRSRLTLLFVSILGFTLVVFSVVLYNFFDTVQRREFDSALYNHAVDLAEGVRVNYFGELQIDTDILSKGEKAFPFSLGAAYTQILNMEGQVMAGSRSLGKQALPFREADRQALIAHGFAFDFLAPHELPAGRAERGRYRFIAYLVNKPMQAPFIIQLAVPYGPVEAQRKSLILFFLIAIPSTLLAAAFGGFYFASRALRPVREITQAANAISANNLDARLPISGTPDELQRLSLTLNQLLDRLHQSFETQERFVADASHQLKTPLAILRGEVDVFKSQTRTAEEMREFLISTSQEIDHLSKIVEDLLLLARMDSGRGALALGPTPVRLDEITMESVSRFKNLAAQKGIRIRLNIQGEDFETRGDADLLRSMLQNLIDNALKYSPAESVVEVTLRPANPGFEVAVSDQGVGLSEDAQTRIFERFYRVEKDTQRAGGVGLGLSIARRIAELHQGEISVRSTPGAGTTFSVRVKKI